MKPYGVLLLVLAACLSAGSQVVGNVAPGPVYSFAPVNAYGYINTGGYATSAPAPGWSLYAPIVHLGAVATPVGATNATMGNMAGATNSTLTAAGGMTPGMVAEVPSAFSAPAQSLPGSSAVSTGTTGPSGTPAPLNLGVGPAPGLVATSTGVGGVNLGQIARSYRQKQFTAHVRTYTNDDIQRINQQSGGASGTAINAGSSTPTSPGVSGSPVLGQPAGTTNPAASPATPSTVTPENTPRTTPTPTQPARPQRTPPPGGNEAAAPQQDATLMAQARPAEPGAAAAGETQASQSGQLPSTGSILPAIAVLGFLATAAGLVWRHR